MGIVSESCPPEALKNPHKHLHALVSPRSIPLKYFGVTHIQAFELVYITKLQIRETLKLSLRNILGKADDEETRPDWQKDKDKDILRTSSKSDK